MKHRNSVVRASAVLLALLAAGCGMFEKTPLQPCPEISVPSDADRLTRYAPGPGRDITDVMFEAVITDFRGDCGYHDNDTRVSINVSVVFTLKRGPANTDRTAAFEYFVAIPRFHPAPEGKRRLPIRVEFVRNRTRMRVVDELELEIPFAKGGTGRDYPVVIGFQLTPDELRANRARRAR